MNEHTRHMQTFFTSIFPSWLSWCLLPQAPVFTPRKATAPTIWLPNRYTQFIYFGSSCVSNYLNCVLRLLLHSLHTHTFTLAGNKSRSLIKECLLWVWMWVLRCSRNSQRTWQRNEVLHTKLDYSRTRGPHRSKVIMELLTSFLAHRKKINKYGLRWERSRNIISSMCFVHKFP